MENQSSDTAKASKQAGWLSLDIPTENDYLTHGLGARASSYCVGVLGTLDMETAEELANIRVVIQGQNRTALDACQCPLQRLVLIPSEVHTIALGLPVRRSMKNRVCGRSYLATQSVQARCSI